MRRLLMVAALGLFSLTVACTKPAADPSDKAQDPKPVESIDKPAPTPTVEAVKPAAKVVADLPTEEDFEEAARKEITGKNLKKELVEIEKSLSD
jgi:hypothetical protein